MRIIIFSIALMAAFSFGAQSKKLSPLPKELQDGVLPDFFVLAIDNETEFNRAKLQEEAKKLGAKRIVLSFFATWCVNCMEEFKVLQKNSVKLKENNVLVYLIDAGEKIIKYGEKVNDFVKEHAGYSFPFYFDPNANLLKDFGIIERGSTQFSLPVIVVLDADLRVLNVFTEAGEDFPEILWSEL